MIILYSLLSFNLLTSILKNFWSLFFEFVDFSRDPFYSFFIEIIWKGHSPNISGLLNLAFILVLNILEKLLFHVFFKSKFVLFNYILWFLLVR